MEIALWNAGNVGWLQATFIRTMESVPQGGYFCSPEQSKLCFEAPEIHFVPQNNLPWLGLLKHPPESGFNFYQWL